MVRIQDEESDEDDASFGYQQLPQDDDDEMYQQLQSDEEEEEEDMKDPLQIPLNDSARLNPGKELQQIKGWKVLTNKQKKRPT